MIQSADEKYNLLLFKNKKDNIIFWSSLVVIFGLIETLLPRFFFIKIGFSFIPILLIYKKISNKELIVIFIFKFLFTNIISGMLFSPSALLSLSGNIVSLILFIFLKQDIFSLYPTSIFISFFSNLSQLYVYEKFVIRESLISAMIFIVIILSVITGFLSAYLVKLIEKHINIC